MAPVEGGRILDGAGASNASNDSGARRARVREPLRVRLALGVPGQHERAPGAGACRVVGIHYGIHLLGDVVVECLASSMGGRRKTAPTASASR